MIRVLLLALSAAGAVQVSPGLTPAEALAPHNLVRAELEAARAAGTLAAVAADWQRKLVARDGPVRWYAAGYAALLAYDRPRAIELLSKSFAASPAAYTAAALAANGADGGSTAECIDWATEGLAVEPDPADVWPQVELRALRAGCLFQSSRYDAHDADLREALGIAVAAGHQRGQALALRVIGSGLHNAGNSAAALVKIGEAIAIDERRGDVLAVALDLMALSYPYPSAHPFEAKLPLLDRAIALAAAARDKFVEGRAYGIRGASNTLLGRYSAAMHDLLTADTKMREVAAVRHRAVTAGNLGGLYTELGDLDRAEAQGRLALAMYRRAGSRGSQRQTLSDLGAIALRRRDVTTALAYQQQVVTLSREIDDVLFLRAALLHLGRTHIARREWDQAEAVLGESVRLSEQAGQSGPIAAALSGLGDMLRLTGRGQQAAAAYARALALASGAENGTLVVTAHHGLALIRAAEGRIDEAMSHYRAAISRIEEIRQDAERAELRMSYFADKQALYVDAIDTLVEADRARPSRDYRREAFMLAERAKARALLDAVAARPQSDRPTSIADLAASLEPSDLVVEFVLGARQSFAFTLTPQGAVAVHRLPPRATLERLVGDLRVHVGQRPATGQLAQAEEPLRRAAQALYTALLGDALTDTAGVGRLILVSDGFLFYAPFEALTRAPEAAYLGDQYEIVRVPSASVLAAARARTPATQATARFVGFGDPLVDGIARSEDAEIVRALERSGFSFAPLPGSRREVTAAAELFGAAASRVYTGRAFTAAAALEELQRPNRIVHFATHAILDEIVPGRSGIVVSHAGGTAAPTILRAQDLAKLRIPVDLIALSGCQTGLGRVVDGEGVTGLSWALSRAGAGTLMVTLWNISDAASATMMVAFYRALRDGQGKAAALTTARRELLRGSNPALRHPYYWAGYALVGDPR